MDNKELWPHEEKLTENGFFGNFNEQASDPLDESFSEEIAPIPQTKKKSRGKVQKRQCRKCGKPIDNANYFFCSICHHTMEDTESHYAYHF